MVWVVVVSVGGGGGGIPSDYFVSTQLQLWLFCCDNRMEIGMGVEIRIGMKVR